MSLDLGLVHVSESWLLLLLVPVIWLVWRRLLLRTHGADLLGMGDSTRSRQQLLVQWISLSFVLVLTLLACLRPYSGSDEVEISLPAGEIAFVVDVSNSMYAADVSPSRLGLAKRKMDDLLRQLTDAGRRDRVSITIFGGAAQLFAPMTADYTVLRSFVRALSPELIRQGGSDPVAGIRVALESFTERADSSRTVILFTDGADGEFSVSEVAQELRRRMARVVVLGLGGKEAVRLTLPDGQPVIDRQGAVVRTALTEDALRALVAEVNGEPGASGSALYLRARVDDGDIERVRSFIAEHSPLRAAETSFVQTYGELGPLFLGFLTLLLVLIVGVGRRRLVFPCLLILCAHGVPTNGAAETEVTPHAGWSAYAAGDYTEAEAIFSDLLAAQEENDAPLLQGLGSAQFRRGRFVEAEKTFEHMSKAAKYKEQRFDAEYNKGNAQFAQGKFEEAIRSYNEALKLFPDERRAKDNRALAERQLSQPPPESPSESPSPTSRPSSSSSSSSSSAASGDRSESQDTQDPATEGAMDQPTNQQSSETPSSRAPASTAQSMSEQAQLGESSQREESAAGSPMSQDVDHRSSSGRQNSSLRDEANIGESSTSARDVGGAESPGSSLDDSDGFTPEKRRSHDDTALRAQEAERWLETLPDSPMLMPKVKGRGPAQGVRSW